MALCSFLVSFLASAFSVNHNDSAETDWEESTGRDVAENRDFTSLSHEIEIPMAAIAKNVGGAIRVKAKQYTSEK